MVFSMRRPTIDKLEKVIYDSPKVDQDIFARYLPTYGGKVSLIIGRLPHICVCGKPKSIRDGKEFCRDQKRKKSRGWSLTKLLEKA